MSTRVDDVWGAWVRGNRTLAAQQASQCPGHPGWHPGDMAECTADLMASNGQNACPVCGGWRVAGRADGTHTETGSVSANGALD